MNNKEIAIAINTIFSRIGINGNNLETGMGILAENKKTNNKVDKLEERLKNIEEWEISTNYVVNDIKKALEEQTKAQLRQSKELGSIKKIFIKFVISLFGYLIIKEIGNWDLIGNFIDILKKIF